MKYIIYNRKSTDEAGNQILSLETQKGITDNIAQNSQLDVIETIQEARSAKVSGNRPLFTAMLTRIRDGEAQGIIVAHVDRLSRNERELADITELFQSGLLKEIRTKDKIYNTLDDIYYIGLDLIGAAQFSRKLAARVKEGNETKRQRGEYTNRAPLGYINKDKKIIPDQHYAPYIKLAFDLYGTGDYSLLHLTKLLNDRGMRSRDGGNLIQKSTLRDVLTNPTYYGVIRAVGKLYKGIHEPLIIKELFDRVQDILTGKRVMKQKNHSFPYRGFLICNICGCRYTATIKMRKTEHIYYYCTNAKHICTEHLRYLTDSMVFNILRDQFAPFSALQGELSQLALSSYINDLESKKDLNVKLREQIALRLQEIDRELKKLLQLLVQSKIEESQYDEFKNNLTSEKINLELQQTSLKPLDPITTLERLERIKNQALSLQTMFDTGDEEVKSDLLKSVLWNVKVQSGYVASVQYKKPWEYLAIGLKNNDFNSLYPVPDSNRRLRG